MSKLDAFDYDDVPTFFLAYVSINLIRNMHLPQAK